MTEEYWSNELDVLKALTHLHGAWKAIEIWSGVLSRTDGIETFPDLFKDAVRLDDMSEAKLQRLFQILLVPDERIELREVRLDVDS